MGADLGKEQFDVYEDRRGKWRWEFVASKWQMVASSAESSASRASAVPPAGSVTNADRAVCEAL
jgi:uncharacterized protein YegP (UPF0339 family)